MRKPFRILMGILCCTAIAPAGAVTIKKAAPVSSNTVATSSSDASSSLITSVIGLASSISTLNQQTRALTAECQPTSQEINFVDTMVKEWAKTGAATAEEVQKALRRPRCTASNGYEMSVRLNAGSDGTICYNWYGDDATDAVWYQFPRVGRTTYCDDGTTTCSTKERKTASDIYEIFNLVDFGTSDYTPAEATMAAKLMDKIEKCSSAKLSAKKRAMWGEFLTNTVSNMGQKTNTGAIMQQVQGLTGGGGGLQSLGGLAQQFLDR